MKWCILGAIYLYRRLPFPFKRQCLFKETCSSFVARMAHEFGGWMALRGLWSRLSQCRPGYRVYFDIYTMDWRIQFANGEISDAGNVADFVLAPYRDHLCGASGQRLYGIDTNAKNCRSSYCLAWRYRN